MKHSATQLEERTARLTILVDPRKKAVFERLCAEEDLTPSQVVRRMIREFIERRTGRAWNPAEEAPPGRAVPAERGATKRRSARSST
jgi:Ribbon-helix-helix protein